MEKVMEKCIVWQYDFKYEDGQIIINDFTGEIATIDQMSIMYIIGKQKLCWAYSPDRDQLIVYRQIIK